METRSGWSSPSERSPIASRVLGAAEITALCSDLLLAARAALLAVPLIWLRKPTHGWPKAARRAYPEDADA